MRNKILIVDDEPDIRALLEDILEDEGYQVDVAASARIAMERKPLFAPDLVLLDIWMPEMDGVSLLKHWNERNDLSCPVVMMSGHGTVETAVEATRYGAYDFIEKPLSMAKLIRVVKAALSNASDDQGNASSLNPELPAGNSALVQGLRSTMQELATHAAPVLFTGRPGADMQIWANYLFSLKPNPMPVRNLAADIPDTVQVGGNNLYVDEVTDLNAALQKVLLNLLRQSRNPNSNARIVAASHSDYAQLKANPGVIPELAEYWRDALYIPTLNEHIEDIPELLDYYVNRGVSEQNLEYRHFGVAAQNLMRNHSWGGGTSAFKQVVQHLLEAGGDEEIGLGEIKSALADPAASGQAEQVAMEEVSGNQLNLRVDLDLDMREAREVFERAYLQTQLSMCNHNVSELARKIGLERTNLYRKLKALGIHGRK